MSRSALNKNANARAAYAQQSASIIRAARESADVRGAIPYIGNPETFNVNTMLAGNINQSAYFVKLCSKVGDWKTLVDEIYYKVEHVEPWAPGGNKVPSSCFCILMRLFTMKVSEKQMHAMLNHLDSPYIRCIGFLFLRYATDPAKLWDWYKPYIYDTEEFSPSLSGKHTNHMITIGEYVRGLINDIDYYSTILPRLPVPIQRSMKVKILQERENFTRAQRNLPLVGTSFYVGAKIRAMYEDEENPMQWYEAIIEEVIQPEQEWETPKYFVTFPEYGNQETVGLGEIELPGDRGGAGTDIPKKDLMEEVLRKEREKVEAKGRNFAAPVRGLKAGMAQDQPGVTKRVREPSPERNVIVVENKRQRTDIGRAQEKKKEEKVFTKEERMKIEEKKRKLAQQYG
mmetsp:Transcript_16300/g.33546  ORF Transcript_16300/g.33546 Transcript_16300/m.33546 type:complete len:400 (+) Transcript_16300:26-1225(+)